MRCPILAIAGELDFSGVAATARYLEANAPNARAEVWPDVAHMIGMEQPERLANAITTFVGPLRAVGSEHRRQCSGAVPSGGPARGYMTGNVSATTTLAPP